MLNNFLFGGKKKQPKKQNQNKQKKPQTKQPPSKKKSPKPENPMNPKITATKDSHQRNFLERFCHKTIVFCGTKEV